MSYIVPREKPEKCANCCPFVDRITYDCMLMYGNDYSDLKSQYEHCPLVEIPTQHGRLIDADVLKQSAHLDGQLKTYIDTWIDSHATVIEAEGET